MTKPLRIGVWAPLHIGSRWQHEGLTRLFAYIAEGTPPEKAEFIILAPRWQKEDIEEDIESLRKLCPAKIECAVHPGGVPFILRIARQLLMNDQRKRNFTNHIWISLKRIRNWLGIKISSFLATPVGKYETLLAWILISPLLAVDYTGRLIFNGTKRLARRSGIKRRIRRRTKLFYGLLSNIKGQLYNFAYGIARDTYQTEFQRMARYANQKLDIDCWLILNPVHVNSKYLEAPLVSIFPDFVPASCPTGFPEDFVQTALERIKELDPHITRFVTLSEHVRKDHAGKLFNIDPKRVSVIPVAPVDLSPSLPRLHRAAESTVESRKKAATIIRDYCAAKIRAPIYGPNELLEKYLKDFPFEDAPYVFVSTQNRPNKNILRVVKAVESILRRDFIDLKLIMTCAIDLHSPLDELSHYIGSQRLHQDILSIPRVPRDVHAALYHCAAVTVHASFFEGGTGSFPFYESLSLGTPILMSLNKSTIEGSDGPDYNEMLFDPYSTDELAKKIKSILVNRQAAFRNQARIYERHVAVRTWSHVADEYLQVFQDAVAEGRRMAS